jgi:hypothetical protein
MDIYITGGAWITANGYGRLSEGKKAILSPGPPVMPSGKDVFSRPLQRYGRFDTYTKLGCAAAALTLKDAGLEQGSSADNIGMVVSTLYEVSETDAAYYQTTLEQGGTLSSPNLFSYTLPVTVLGECAVQFNLTGPAFCVGESEGIGKNALQCAAGMISSGKTNRMIAGWIDSPPTDVAGGNNNQPASGAMLVMLDERPGNALFSCKKIEYERGRLVMNDGRELSSILDIMNHGKN